MRASIAAAFVSLVFAASLGGQQATVGASAQQYRFRDPTHAGLAQVELLAAPFAASFPIGRYLLLDVEGGLARGRVSGVDGAAAELTGLTNTRVALHLLLASGRLALRIDGDAPTAAGTQTIGEARVAGVMGGGLLPFATPYWDGRGAVGGRVTGTLLLGSLTLALAGGYRTRFEGELMDGSDFVYRPGDELELSAVADVGAGKTGFVTLMVGVHKFFEDVGGGQNLFRAGTRIQALASYGFAVGSTSSAAIHVGVRARAEGEGLAQLDWLPGISSAPAQQLFVGGLDARLRRGSLTLFPEVALRLMRTTSGVCFDLRDPDFNREILCPSGQGWTATAGLAAEVPVRGRRPAERLILVPRVRVGVGQVVDWVGKEVVEPSEVRLTDGPRSGFYGWEVGVALRWLVGP